MPIQIDIQNFRKLNNVRMYDDSKFSIVLGYNETGKTSLISAIQFAMTGSALGKRGKDVRRFVSHGQDRMSVRVKVAQNIFCRTQSTGDEIKSVAERLCVPTDVLPLLFDAKLNGDGGGKAMKAFLDNCASSMFDPVIHFANDPRIKPMVEQARRAGKLSTKHIIDYCESMRASSKTPTEPVMPSTPRPSDDDLKALTTDNDQARNEWQNKIKATQEAIKVGQELAEIVHFQKAWEQYEKLKAAASIVDPLKDRRDALTKFVNINIKSVEALQKIADGAGFKEVETAVGSLIVVLNSAIKSAAQLLSANPSPIPLAEPPMLSDGATKTYEALAADGVKDEDIYQIMLESNGLVNAARADENDTLTIKQQMQGLYDEAQRLRGAWDAYNEQLPLWDEAKAKAITEWERWDFGAKEIAKAEIEHANLTGDSFGAMVSEFSQYILQGKKVKISRDEGIFVGVDPIDECSESTKWRVEVAIMAAVARTLKSPLLLIDGADILDIKNRNLISQFLLERIVPYFDHTIVTATPRGLIEEEKVLDHVTKWILKEGSLSKLEAAPTTAAAGE